MFLHGIYDRESLPTIIKEGLRVGSNILYLMEQQGLVIGSYVKPGYVDSNIPYYKED